MNITKENKCDGIVKYCIDPTPEEFKKKYKHVKFEIIDSTKDFEEFVDTANKYDTSKGAKNFIDRSNITNSWIYLYQTCRGVVDKFIFILDFDENDIIGSAKSVEEFVKSENMEDIPIFFVFDGCTEKSFKWNILLLGIGYIGANHLVELVNKMVVVKTKFEICNSMLKKRFEEYENFNHLN